MGPEGLKDKVLYPVVTFRNMTIMANFGGFGGMLKSLPFSIRMIQDAAAEDVEAVGLCAPDDGKYDVVVPVGLPDEGTFDWVDSFLKKNPQYTELSSRKLID